MQLLMANPMTIGSAVSEFIILPYSIGLAGRPYNSVSMQFRATLLLQSVKYLLWHKNHGSRVRGFQTNTANDVRDVIIV